MSFKEAPSLVLDTQADVAEAIAADWRANGCPAGANQWKIKSLWLISLIDRTVADGNYPYNATIKRLAETALGFAPKSEAEYSREGDTLSLLIYNAQCYRRSDALRAEGFEPATEALVSAIGIGGHLWLRDGVKLTIKATPRGPMLFRPRHRTMALAATGFPVRRTPLL
jgi:hypothetical protein